MTRYFTMTAKMFSVAVLLLQSFAPAFAQHLDVLCGVVALTLAMHNSAENQQPPPAGAPPNTSADAAPSGSDLYLRHCAICHGIDGRGHGPLTEAMKIVPADLTRVTVRNGGGFPDAKVSDVIRNGGGVLGHGSMAMLPWGFYFSERRKPAVGKARIRRWSPISSRSRKNRGIARPVAMNVQEICQAGFTPS